MKVLQRSRRLAWSAASAALVLGLAGGAVTVSGDAQARPVPTRSVGASWGIAIYGNLGFGRPGEDARTLAGPVTGLTGVRQVAAGGLHSLALTSDGSVWAFGNNSVGQLGNGSTDTSYVPVQVPGLTGVTQIAAGTNSAMAALTRGFITTLTTVWTWGDNGEGELGDRTLTSRSTPGQVAGIDVPGVRGIAVGDEFSMVLGSDGSVWAWGADGDGQLGNAATETLWVGPVETIGKDSGITQISAGYSHVLALRSDGTVLAWGDNNAGEIGNGTYSGTPSLPTEVTGLTGVTQVSAGLTFSLAAHNVRFIAASA
jgi:alpha-tubulin suppressor-like RCC1 family protein